MTHLRADNQVEVQVIMEHLQIEYNALNKIA